MSHAVCHIYGAPEGLKEALERAATQLFTADDRMTVHGDGDVLFITCNDRALDWYCRHFGLGITRFNFAFHYFRGFIEGVARGHGYTGAVIGTLNDDGRGKASRGT